MADCCVAVQYAEVSVLAEHVVVAGNDVLVAASALFADGAAVGKEAGDKEVGGVEGARQLGEVQQSVEAQQSGAGQGKLEQLQLSVVG